MGEVDGPVQLWDVATGRAVTRPFAGDSDSANAIAFSPDGAVLATGGEDGTVWLWNATTGERIGGPLADGGRVNAIAFSPDGETLFTGNEDGTVRLWDEAAATARQIGTGSPSLIGSITWAAFSPGGTILATCTNAARLWDVATGQQIGGPTGGTGSAAVAFSPDGKTLAIANQDGAVQLWNVSYLTDSLAELCARIGGSVTRAEWAEYVPAGPAYRNACA